ncbi:MAG: endonuclease/exonuclease/phosphatase family protein [Flavobacteriales bacterium]|nr:endonuclease/exonuclease/phosphatase family protein [Flavobacteriia bacterium]NCP06471.1 endonuclease/exonuclease/phosphatase family protein [Flavobacteriales bacterium]PIV93124.1 MAG: endonuclease/exonuclease/phosphatase [Flavobacteriaceae bacterium CG17_big_fil_post_rev_8_21_14_2_50_33_15]PIY11546.1 MAG: endonuclease/exonuclease/phosphatase [Flavobacteriaceae bacterium CG_4_10_14_3_um_filter_33_47]PJB18855.1 MAG: endonuclease/exonuclease/phosphatase [Flavobacteriaceae bacterium CG_4_9_14_3
MKKIFFLCHLFFALCLNAQDISIMTYNIKLDYPKEGENSWENRKPFMLGQLQFYEPDIFGVQEAMPNQMKDLDSLLINYDFVGVGRDDGFNQGEYSAIFYNNNKFKVLNSSTFWLSQTPDKVSMGWDAVCNRVCTYALFENLNTGNRFYVFNTHFDHVGVEARKNSAILILKKVADINTENHPVVLMGDFNMEEGHESIQYITKHLNDSKAISKLQPFGPTGTFNGFNFHEPVTNRIDFIFVSSEISVEKYVVLSDSKDCKYPSDHLPVLILAKII